MKKYLIIFATMAFVSCSDFGDINVDTKSATAVPAETVFANATRNLVDQMTESSVNANIFRHFSQAWAQTTYQDETNYNLINRDQPGAHWAFLYRDVLKDLDEAKVIINDTDNSTVSAELVTNQLATISILEVYTYHVLVDSFGDVPFTEALDIDNVLPAYDDDAAIYAAIITQLDVAIASITVSEGSFGGSDLIYAGDMAKWKKFANSLKLRMAVRIESVDAGKAATMASEAVASGVFTSNDDNATFAYLDGSPNTNPVWTDLVESGRQDFIGSNTIIDIMNDLEDPRRAVYFADNLQEDGSSDTYVGGPYGVNAPYGDYSHIGDLFHQPDTPGDILDYAEVEFLLAEAAELGLVGSPADAPAHYEAAITASFDFWSVDDVATYLANPAVAYATAASTWQEKIAVQKWLHLFNRGFEAWSTYRKYDFPMMNIPPTSGEDVPRRYTYPVNEPTRNGASYSAASAAMGGDTKASTVFWDVN
ncbi:SusD/RagB family nutrient-binding outer membrane lipoprotein [Zobellia barbeyronii]|uniref:SusD/RagB family nutrient-binding outer membrane lipoprotein n=1 Tax=Zobellia barbeyronii TaxID=2748009 RepID=A0ABS5WG92_9FLAO|nr:SusD/RagB family nutrient-binding outer membrane lipoprotein [Zobellia barbeyronii]MBT2162406.1 SusD/RagB family nutrient-binding outer membrane lipoprotein [Zobellia barbeyronii]